MMTAMENLPAILFSMDKNCKLYKKTVECVKLIELQKK